MKWSRSAYFGTGFPEYASFCVNMKFCLLLSCSLRCRSDPTLNINLNQSIYPQRRCYCGFCQAPARPDTRDPGTRYL